MGMAVVPNTVPIRQRSASEIKEAMDRLAEISDEYNQLEKEYRRALRKECRELSKRGWIETASNMKTSWDLSSKPEHPFRISMGGSDRCH